uniref:Uncharacterized protein n=1 Tax=Anguilla anguilla TaxID=7936 RepID=A0A0E9V8F2_ANGAN
MLSVFSHVVQKGTQMWQWLVLWQESL